MNKELELALSRLPTERSWRLARWLLDTGADEFTLGCVWARSQEPHFCRAAEEALATFRLPEAGPGLTHRTGRSTRDRTFWRFNEASLGVLEALLPDGIFTDRQGADSGWLEDLMIYQGGHLRLAVSTHEHEAILRLSDEQRQEVLKLELLD